MYLKSKKLGILCVHILVQPFLRKAVNKNFSEHLQQTGIPSGSQDKVSVPDSGLAMAEPRVAVAPVVTSKLSVKAPEFYPSGYNQNFNQNFAVSVYLLLSVYANLLIFTLTMFS